MVMNDDVVGKRREVVGFGLDLEVGKNQGRGE
jgi:hypothetical protein